MSRMKISERIVGDGAPVFVIAEAGINHDGDPAVAGELVRRAAHAGADAVKFQTYITEKRVSRDSPIYENLKRCELSYAAQERLKRLADEEGILFFSTPFDDDAVDFLSGLGVLLFKIASFDLVNGRLLEKVAATGRPVILSRGMADRGEIETALRVVSDAGCEALLLHCVSAYPTPPEDANLRAIRKLGEAFPVPVGFSDHTVGIRVPVAAVAAGACAIEKHFTLDRDREGGDHALSVDPEQLEEMVSRIREMESILGSGEIACRDVERDILRYRRPS